MIIDLKSVFANEHTSLPLAYTLDCSDLEYMGEFPLKKPVLLKGTVSNKASLVQLEAELSFEYEAPCDRCGQLAVTPYVISVQKALATSIEGEESETILTVPDMKLDLDELMYTEVVVNLPMKHLCREDCAGLCPRCGKNLNEEKCGCQTKEIDPRFAALAELLNS